MSRTTASRALDHAALLLFGGAVLSAWVAWLHMRDLVGVYGVMCGSAYGAAPHCPPCFPSAALLAISGGFLALGPGMLPPARFRPTGVVSRRPPADD